MAGAGGVGPEGVRGTGGRVRAVQPGRPRLPDRPDQRADEVRPQERQPQHVTRYQPDAIKANWPLVDLLTEFGNHRGLTAAQVVLAWLQAQKPWIVSIPGTTKLAHLQENLSSSEFKFSGDELKTFTEAVSKIKIVGDRYAKESAQQIDK